MAKSFLQQNKRESDIVLPGQKTVAPMQGEGVAKVTSSHPSIATSPPPPLPSQPSTFTPPQPQESPHPWVAIYRSYLLSVPNSQIMQPISLIKHQKERVQRGFAIIILFSLTRLTNSNSFLLVLLSSTQSLHVSKPYSAGHVKQKLFFLVACTCT